MTDQINARDWERLSAYLDGALSETDTRRLELRLAAEPALADVLAQLERTRYLLRQTPQARPPRAFALTAAMAGERGHWLDRLPFSLTMVSAMASIMLVFVLLGDFVTPGGIVSLDDMLPAAAPAAEMAVEEEAQTFALDAPPEPLAEGADTAEESSGDEALVLPSIAEEGDLADQRAEDSGERLIEEQLQQEPATVRRLHLFLLEAVLALVALVSGLGAWLQRRMS